MKYPLTFVILLTNLTLFAQTDLFVSDNSNTYVYVDGTGFAEAPNVAPLFVTNSINLAGTNSFIYLRNEAQLLQGTVSTNNSGTGKLSVYQRGTVSKFNYNYWCSPVGNTTANTTLNRNFVPNNNLYGRDLGSATPAITSSLANFTNALDGTANPFEISNRWIYTFSPGAFYSDWDQLGASGTSGLPGYGFTMKGVSGTDGTNNPGDNQLYDFRGKPNSGEIIVPVLASQFTLTGNPYPSALDARDFFHLDPENRAAIAGSGSGALLFWEQISASHLIADYVGGYGLYTIEASGLVSYTAAPFITYDSAGNAVGTLGGPSPNNAPGVNAPGRYLPVGQGFMVEGATNADIFFRNTYREYWKESSGNSHFFRGTEPNAQKDASALDNGNVLPEKYMRFRIIYDIKHNSQFFSRELLVNMVDYATEDYDYGMEAKLPEVLPSDLYLVCNEVPFGILAVPFTLERKIPLIAKVANEQNVKFRAYELQNFPDDLNLYLHDIQNNLYVNLRQQDYEISLEAGTYANRFEITFTDETLSTPEITAADFKIFQDNPQSQLTILNPNGLDVKNVRLFDTSGKQIYDAHNLKNEAEYHFTTNTLSEGVYVATITLSNNQVISKKVIVKN